MAIPNSADILQAVIEATPDAIFVKDLGGRYMLVNEAAARFLGKSPIDIIGKHDLELYPEETARQFIEDDKRVLARGEAQSFEGVATSEGGAKQAYLVTKGVYRDRNGQILGTFGISHDITELQQAHKTLAQTREALFQSQKMEAVGQLTGGIAHDFNNILAVILGNVELLRLTLAGVEDSKHGEFIDIVMRAVSHGRDLTSQLLAFSRRRALNPQPTDINALVAHVVRLLTRTLGATIRIVSIASADAGAAFVDPQALEAAVINIALNARDAMLNGGSLTLRTSQLIVTEPMEAGDDLKPGPYAVLAIEDTGIGMSPEIVARAFEPFFTTKDPSRGTGLGLSMVYGFVKQTGGKVRIESQLGRGTRVTLYLPLATGESALASSEDAPVKTATVSRTILIVEDEADVRQTLRRQLETLGHHVLGAEGPTEGLLLVTASAAPDVLLTDVVLGSTMDGIDLAEAARRARPDLPVIFMSGHTAGAKAQDRIRRTGAPLLTKPFSVPQLDRAISAVCAAVPTSP